MAQEKKKLILGIDLNPDYVQATYWYTGQSGEPQSLDAEENTQMLDPETLLLEFLKPWIGKLEASEGTYELHVMVTVRSLTEQKNSQIVGALQKLGLDRKKIYVQDYLASFYYYAVNQKKELWAQDVAMLTYEDESIVGYVLHIDRSKKPALAQVNEVARQPMDETVRSGRSEEDWNKEKDRLFFELLKKVFERRNVAVSYLIGDYFNKSWASRSIQFLCTQRRAYQGMNLYSKGACFAAMERAGVLPGRGLIFGGKDMVERNLGMEMLSRGKETFYSLVDAGVNWYEVHSVCEFILHGERVIRLISRPMEETAMATAVETPRAPQGAPGSSQWQQNRFAMATAVESTEHMMRLPGLPKRPDRATRLRMTVYFTSPSLCHVDVEDLGFGGLYKSSGLSWSREILL